MEGRRGRLLAILLAAVAVWSVSTAELAVPPVESLKPTGKHACRIPRRASTLHDAATGAYRGPATAEPPWPRPSPRAGEAITRRALLIGLDGTRADALEAARAPVLHALIEHGAYSPDTLVRPLDQRFAATTSGPGWSSILTGVWPAAHGVLDNEFLGHRLALHPSLFAMLRAQRPDAWSASLASWPQINGEIVRGADWAPVEPDEAEPPDVADAHAARTACELLATRDPTLMFVYFRNIDETGHRQGFDPASAPYMEAIAGVDRRVGEVLAALKARPSIAREDWLVLVVTDHGGRGLTHGFNDDPPACVSRTFLIVGGAPCRPGLLREETAQVDVVPTVLAHLGVPADPRWHLRGGVVGLAAR